MNALQELTSELSNPAPDWSRVIYLKELGRASYKNPVTQGLWSEVHNERIAERASKSAHRLAGDEDISKCPCCGVDALTNIEEIIDDEDGGVVHYTNFVKCECCTFYLPSEVGNASDHRLTLPDYFGR